MATAPVPAPLSGKAATEERIYGAEALQILVRSWRPETAPRGVLVICHGVNSHSGYYTWAATQLTDHGLAVFALDLHGRGQSEGERYYTYSIDEYVADVDAVVELARSRHPGQPIFLLGHSAGGVVASVYVLEHQKKLAGLICESFALEVAASDFKLRAVKGLSLVAPHLHVLKLKNEEFSRDPQVVKAMNEDPLIRDESEPALTVAALVRADERLRAEFADITLPVLILHGTADKVTNPHGSQVFYDKAGSTDKTLKLYEGHVHDLLNDVGKETVMADIAGWIERRLTQR